MPLGYKLLVKLIGCWWQQLISSLLKRVVDDVNEVIGILTPKISVKSEVYNPEAYNYNSVPILGFF